MKSDLLSIKVEPDFAALRDNLLRNGTPRRVHYLELSQDAEIKEAIARRFNLMEHLDPADRFYRLKREVAIQSFLGYDVILVNTHWLALTAESQHSQDMTAIAGQNRGERIWADEHRGPIASWQDFERYPWPDPAAIDFSGLDWAERNLPDNMKVYAPPFSLFEYLVALFGFETLCYAMYDDPELVDAVMQRIGEIQTRHAEIVCDYSCVGMLFGGDDMGYKTNLLVPRRFLVEKIFPWYRQIVAHAHSKGKLCILHSCGKIESLMDTIIDVGFDGRHSFEEIITPVTEAKRLYGDRIAVIGGLDMDFMVRATPSEVRERARQTLALCLPGGGYCLGVGNTVANYVPLENYLAMLDEGRRYLA